MSLFIIKRGEEHLTTAPPKFPRVREGFNHPDDGTALNKDACPNCKSRSYKETVSTQYCPSCGLFVDYWGSGDNSVCREYLERKWKIEEEEERQRELEQDEE